MLANVGAVMSFAAEAPLAISLSAPTNVKAGESFAVTVNFDSSDAAKEWSGGAIPLAYNSNYVSENDVASMAKLDGYATSLDEGNFTTYEPMYGTELTAEEAATMNTIKVFGFTGTGKGTDVSAGVDCMTVTFTVGSDVADGTKIRIAVPTMAVDETIGELYFYDHANECEWYGNSNADMSGYQLNYDISAAYVDVTVGEEGYPIEYVHTQRRNDGDKFDIGVKFSFSPEDIDIKFYEEGEDGIPGRSKNVASVGADIYVNDVKVDGVFESPYVYLVGDEYQYRVIIEDRTVADTNTYKIVPYVVYTDSSIPTTYGEPVEVNPSVFLAAN
jgi:hypothetical protein